MPIHQNFELMGPENNQAYCQNWLNQQPSRPSCSHTDTDEGLNVDCSGLGPEESLPGEMCFLQKAGGCNKIKFKFPLDVQEVEVADFGIGESALFFKDFNGRSVEYSKLQKSLTLYDTKIDLATLPGLTGNRTEEVYVQADTVYMSSPMHLTYKLFINARKVSINQALSMEMDWQAFIDDEAWTNQEKYIYIDQDLTVRYRKFGQVEVLDEAPNQGKARQGACTPGLFNLTEVDTSRWFDFIGSNINYVCARTIYDTNPELSASISKFQALRLQDKDLVDNLRLYMTGQKFKRIVEQYNAGTDVYNVPTYTLNTVKELAEVMYDKLSRYRDSEEAMEGQIFSSQLSVQAMQAQFSIAEQQQEMYFQLEQVKS